MSSGAGDARSLLHGFPNDGDVGGVVPELAKEFTVVRADLRGYGDSAKPKCLPDRSNYSFRAMAEDQLGLMRQLGFERFHVVGHDRGGRTSHRMALDHPEAVMSLSVMDIVPTYAMFMDANRFVSSTYWHWYFLSQPELFPERLIGNDPTFSTKPALWAGRGDDRRLRPGNDCAWAAWRKPGMIHGSAGPPGRRLDRSQHDHDDLIRRSNVPPSYFLERTER